MASLTIGSILVVCVGNICRSPAGERILAAELLAHGSPIRVGSAGIGALVGHAADETAAIIAADTGQDVERIFTDVFGAKASLITTNVPGPREPLHLAGRRLDGVLFWVPQSAGVALGVSLFSYAGRVVWGISADAGRLPDPGVLVDHMHRALADLAQAAGIAD